MIQTGVATVAGSSAPASGLQPAGALCGAGTSPTETAPQAPLLNIGGWNLRSRRPIKAVCST